MNDFLRFALLGIGVGAIYGLSAQGLVLIFLGNKVLNFSQGAIALLAAYTYFELSDAGVPMWPSVLLALLGSAALGAVIEVVIMRPLRDASSVTRLVATIGLLTVIQSAALLRYGDSTQFVKGVLPRTTWHITDRLIITSDRALLLAIGIVVTLVLIGVYRHTRFGTATVAVAENPRAAEVLGWSSQTISLANWALGALLAGGSGILIAPINGLNVVAMSNVVYGALAAALIGGFRSFGWAMAGGLLLGVAQAETVRISGDAGWSTAIPFLVIIGAVLLRKNTLSTRGDAKQQLPTVGAGQIKASSMAVVAIVVGLGTLLLSGNMLDALSTSLIAAIIGLSVVVSTGYAGQLSLAQYAVAGLGALVAARLAAEVGLPFILSLLAGAIAGALAGALIAAISLRVRGDTVAIVTLGVALSFQALVLANPVFTGGISGLPVPPPTLLGMSFDSVVHPTRFAVLCAVILVLCCLAVSNLRRGEAGRRLLATRSGERAATTLGVSATGAKVYALTVAGALAGLAGGVEAFSQPQLVFTGFTIDAAMALLVAVVLAGTGYIAAGPMAGFAVTGGLVYYLLTLTGWQQYLPLALGVLLLINLVLVPDGLVPQNAAMVRALARRLSPGRAAADVPPAVPAPLTPSSTIPRRGATLEIRDLHVSFGGVTALDHVSLSVPAGAVEGLIGPNGAGKTTLIDAVTGVTRRYGGAVLCDGKPFGHESAAARARAGLGRTLQGLELFDELTVLENLEVGSGQRSKWAYLRDLVWPKRMELSPGAVAAVHRFGLVHVLDRRPHELPYGQRRLVAIARAVAAQPSVLLLDEPAAGLSAHEREELVTLIRDLVGEHGMGVLLVEHDVDLVMKVCDHITVLEFGKVVARGTPAEIRADHEVRRAFLGETETV
ncbi:branched-chain amino acid ABC transporter permease/ATP-binding protein [Rhodococcus sp. JS3073]|uniref:branched-chain amino acid ABC transporter permease/ATP-binding protein n=1 Tax=Rhodococcus sp. JS3073 TaxID=3002901 RepID=UPI0022854D02|nr:branched-chain amino acid ABC transporter permease/ATP-binding protein [Rhodococcus sp. JS3073]WAM19760.1 branched-chain amino acid ABC transporter permease/ATP-binding protein [Rhodococcus sp. JS3073]